MRRMPTHQLRTVIQAEDEVITPIVSFVGDSNSGKTTLLEKVVGELKSKGYRVVVIKHSPHGFDIDQPGKDTWRLTQAGSDIVVISSPDQVAFIERVGAELTLSQIERSRSRSVSRLIISSRYSSSNSVRRSEGNLGGGFIDCCRTRFTNICNLSGSNDVAVRTRVGS